MTAALSWLGDIASAILQLVPRFMLIRSTHMGVKFGRGGSAKRMDAGMHFWWPFWSDIVTYPVVRQPLDLPPQALTTRDDITVHVQAVVVYRVDDILTAMTIQDELDNTVRVLSQAAVKLYVASHNYSVLRNHRVTDAALKDNLQKDLLEYGVEVVMAVITDFARTHVYTMIGSRNGIVSIEED